MRTTFSSERALLNSRLYKRTSLGGGLFVRKESAAYRYITNDSMSLYFVMDGGNGDYSVYASNHGMIDREHRYCAIREDGGLSADALPLILASNAESNTRLTSQAVNTLGKITSAQQKIPYITTGTIKTTPTEKNTVLLVIGTPDEVYHINGHVEVKTLVVLGCNLIVHGDINVTDHIYAYCRSITAHHVTGGVDAIYANALHWIYTPGWNSVCSNPNGGCKEVLHNLSDELFSAMHDRNWITAYQKEKFLAQRLAISQAATNNALLFNRSLQKAIDANEALDNGSHVAATAPASTATLSMNAAPNAHTSSASNVNLTKAPNPAGNTNNATNNTTNAALTNDTNDNAFAQIDSPASNRTLAGTEPVEQKLVEIDTTVPVNNFIDSGLLEIDRSIPANDPATNEILANSITPAAEATLAPASAIPPASGTSSIHGVATTIAADSSQPTSSLTLDHDAAASPMATTSATTTTATSATAPTSMTTNTTATVPTTQAMPMTAMPTTTMGTPSPSLAAAQPIKVTNVATNTPEIQQKVVTETDVYKLLANPNTPLSILETIVDTLDGTFSRTPHDDNDYRKLAKAFILKLLRKSKQELLDAISLVLTLAQYEEQIAHQTKEVSDKAAAADRATADRATAAKAVAEKAAADKATADKAAAKAKAEANVAKEPATAPVVTKTETTATTTAAAPKTAPASETNTPA